MTRLAITFSILIYCALLGKLSAQEPRHSSYSRNWEWMEEFDGNGHNWLGMDLTDNNGSASIVNDAYCKLSAAEGHSMIIATEYSLDQKRDFEIHCKFQVLVDNPDLDYKSSLATLSWGVSFENHSQHNIGFTSNGLVIARAISGSVKELIKPKQVDSWQKKSYNYLVISKINDEYKVYLNQDAIGSFNFNPLAGNGLVFTAGSNLSINIDFIRIAYLEDQLAKSQPPRLIFDDMSDEKIIQTENDFFEISGYITDEDGLKSFTINGNTVPVDKSKFSAKLPLALGKNIVKVEAIDLTNQVNTRYFEVVRVQPKAQFITSQKRLALVIGNSRYKHTAPLKNTINDAREMKNTLQLLNFEVLLYEDLNYQELREAVREYSDKIDHYDVSMFFYAGHGIQVDDKNYLIPVDAKLDHKKDIAFEAIEVEKVLSILEHQDENSLNLLILDACRNNPFRSWERGGSEGLTSVTPPSGTLVAYATSPGSFASDGYGDNGLYTSELIKQLQKSQRIEDVFINTRIAVEEKSGGSQSPWELARLRGIYFLK